VGRAIYDKAFRGKETTATPENEETLRTLLSPSYEEWIHKHGFPDLFYTRQNEQTINLATLQRISLCHHQKRISGLVKEIMRQDPVGPADEISYGLNAAMREYSRCSS
jgi:hypothetical protein